MWGGQTHISVPNIQVKIQTNFSYRYFHEETKAEDGKFGDSHETGHLDGEYHKRPARGWDGRPTAGKDEGKLMFVFVIPIFHSSQSVKRCR